MEDLYSVNSPRRVLSLSRRRKESPSFSKFNDKGLEFGSSGRHGPKPSEVYGFVGAITTVVAMVIFFIWAYVPDSWLHSVGISYYPSRYWALAVPTYAMVVIALAIVFYIGLNFLVTPPPTSFNTIFDEYSREPLSFEHTVEGDEQPIEPISDLGLDQINDLMFK